MFFYEYAFVSLVLLKRGIFLGIRHLVKNRVPGKMEVNIVKRDALIFFFFTRDKKSWHLGRHGMGINNLCFSELFLETISFLASRKTPQVA